MIEDDELRALFAAESEEHLQSLDEGLLRLETSPRDAATLEEVFRAAHSLKGTARMLGVDGVETLAHHLEDELGGARRGRATLDAGAIDRMCFGVDAIRLFVDEAVVGTPVSLDLARALAQLSGQTPLDNAKAPSQPAPSAVPAAEEPQEQEAVLEAPPKYLQPDAESQIELPAEPQVLEVEEVEEERAGEQPEAPKYLGVPVAEIPAIPLPAASVPVSISTSAPLDSELLLSVSAHIGASASATFTTLAEVPVVEAPVSEPAVVQAPVVEAPIVEVSASLVPVEETPEALEVVPLLEEALAVVPDVAPSDIEVAPTEFKIQTMRVPPAQLDALMTLASELAVTTSRVERGLHAFDALSAQVSEWRKDVAEVRLLLNGSDGASAGGASSSSPEWKKVGAFHEREQARLARFEAILAELKQTSQQDMARLSFVAGELEDGIRNVRLLPFSSIFSLFARPVRDLAREQSKEVQIISEGGETLADKRILEELKDPLLHMIRNGIDHGIETPGERANAGKPRAATLRLRAFQTSSNVMVELSDDGRGLNLQAIKRTAIKRGLHTREELEAMEPEMVHGLIFAPGFSTAAIITDVSGRGVGMDVVRTNVEKLKGTIQVRSNPGQGTSFLIRLPITLATTRVLLVEVAGHPYALPIEFVHSMMPVAHSQFFALEGREAIMFRERALHTARLADLLQLPCAALKADEKATCVVLEVGEEKIGLLVDALIDEQEVMLKSLGAMLKRVRNISGATILGTGEVCLILSPHDLHKTMHLQRNLSRLAPASAPLQLEAGDDAPPRRKSILLAEDSIATRTLEKRILEAAGYEVTTAVDGADAFGKLGGREFDALVSDVEMPNLTGLQLAVKIRLEARYNEMPIILVTSLASEEDRRRGAEAGANAYITKGNFEQKALLDALGRLI